MIRIPRYMKNSSCGFFSRTDTLLPWVTRDSRRLLSFHKTPPQDPISQSEVSVAYFPLLHSSYLIVTLLHIVESVPFWGYKEISHDEILKKII